MNYFYLCMPFFTKTFFFNNMFFELKVQEIKIYLNKNI